MKKKEFRDINLATDEMTMKTRDLLVRAGFNVKTGAMVQLTMNAGPAFEGTVIELPQFAALAYAPDEMTVVLVAFYSEGCESKTLCVSMDTDEDGVTSLRTVNPVNFDELYV